VTRLIATFGFIGVAPVAAGTIGSVAALAAGYLLHVAGGPALLLAAIALAAVLGTWATRVEAFERHELERDQVVIDEVVGQWIALLPLSAGLWFAGAPPHLFPWPGWVSAFLLFRLLDLWKPGPVGWAARRPGPAGVMLDDVFAGLITAALVMLMAAVAHRWLA
jgi:phosphatidylglycerophosphatase A